MHNVLNLTRMQRLRVLKHSAKGAVLVGEILEKEITSMRNETMRTQEAYKIVYWPAVQDSRSRTFRKSNLDIQMDSFTGSLDAFQSHIQLVSLLRDHGSDKPSLGCNYGPALCQQALPPWVDEAHT